ncbi:MAG TPA: peptidylprolyl isomerase [Geobacter sp.]|nr:peptidylprolyl isomerase [Geobacter sp.]
METGNGKRVSIRYKCRVEDGRLYLVGEHNTLEFVIGARKVPPSLEAGLLGMKQGDHRIVRVPASEGDLFPFPAGSHLAFNGASTTTAYDFGPGNGGDVSLLLPGKTRRHREPLPPGQDLLFEVEMLSVEEGESPKAG